MMKQWCRKLSGPLLSAVLLAALFVRLGDPRIILEKLPSSPLFWAALFVNILALPASELLIYRRIMPGVNSGIRIFIRKRIANELFIGYSGEAYLGARFLLLGAGKGAIATIKDVSVTSAIAGSIFTTLLLAASWQSVIPWLGHAHMWAVLAGVAVLTLPALLPVFVWRRIFHLPPGSILRMTMVHLGRLGVTEICSALLWMIALPELGLTAAIGFVCLRMVAGRLPFIPNKDLLFAAFLALAGSGAMAVTATAAMLAIASTAATAIIFIGGEAGALIADTLGSRPASPQPSGR